MFGSRTRCKTIDPVRRSDSSFAPDCFSLIIIKTGDLLREKKSSFHPSPGHTDVYL